MKLKKLCFALVAVLILCSCSSNPSQNKPDSSGSPANSVNPVNTENADTTAKATQSDVLNVLTWEGYVPEEVVESFEKDTGIRVQYSNFNDNEEMLAKLQASKGGEYDVIICSDYIIEVMLNEGNLLHELDFSKIPNSSNIDPAFQFNNKTGQQNYTVPYAAATAILAYDKDALGFEINSYEDLWREELLNSVVLINGDRDVIGLTLQSLGYSLNETDPVKLEEAKNKLIKLKPNIIGLNTDTPHEMLISGVAKAGYMFGSQITAAMNEKPSITYAYPSEGVGFYIDYAVVAANAPNLDNAYTFIDYILKGENSAKISSLINYINCNTKAKEFLPQEYLDNKTVNLPDEIMKKAESYQNLGETSKIYNRIYTEFKAS